MNFNKAQAVQQLRSIKAKDLVAKIPTLESFSIDLVDDETLNAWAERVTKNINANIRVEREHRAHLRNVLSNHVRFRKVTECVDRQEAEVSNELNEAIAECDRFLSDMNLLKAELISIKRDRLREAQYRSKKTIVVNDNEVELFTALIDVDDLFISNCSSEVDGFMRRRFYSLQETV